MTSLKKMEKGCGKSSKYNGFHYLSIINFVNYLLIS